MGCAPIPRQPVDQEAWIDAFTILGKDADYVLHHVHIDWELFVETPDVEVNDSTSLQGLEFVVGMAKSYNLGYLLVLDPLTSNREDLEPNSLGSDFNASGVRQAFKNIALRIARDYTPVYFALFSEINTYIMHHSEDKNNVLSLFEETALLVKQYSPGTKILTTFQYESMSGLTQLPAHFNLINEFEENLDVVGITTYPSPFFIDPNQIPDDYYTKLKTFTGKPIIIAESGWPSGGNSSFHGSEQNQRNFLFRVFNITQDINLILWVWWFLHDWAQEGYEDFFKTMGLRTSTGTEKTSWLAWISIHNMNYKPERI
jgi:hypothetical protein